MDDVYNSLTIATLDGQQSVELSGVSQAMSLARFKTLVAIRIGKLERRYVNPTDLELMVFGEIMTEGGRQILDLVWCARYQAPAPASLIDMDKTTQPPPYVSGGVLRNVFVQDAGRTYTLNDVPLGISIEDFFGRLRDEKQLPPGSIRVIFAGKELTAGRGRTLSDYNVQNDSTLHIVVSMVGG
ncbi:hypothetical protein FKW77_010465 [Venturia effusa]|uniref:Ubiquitin-like domain-containing protein n=1 Tax=Venturia effusa TaxID=50376 RepID=A0A517L6H0_9PEZI|nr:hypothetical protein FKW77_010465 [Venturia effusa]